MDDLGLEYTDSADGLVISGKYVYTNTNHCCNWKDTLKINLRSISLMGKTYVFRSWQRTKLWRSYQINPVRAPPPGEPELTRVHLDLLGTKWQIRFQHIQSERKCT